MHLSIAAIAAYMLVIESTLVEIAGAAERNSAGVTENFPLPLRSLYREHGACAVNQFAVDKAAVDQIECQRLEASHFGHTVTDRSE